MPPDAVEVSTQFPIVVAPQEEADEVVNDTSEPYAVPAELVAYARTWYFVPAARPVMELDQGPPIAHPLVVFESEVVGFAEVLQAMPLTVTVAPPLEVMVPPLVAPVWVMLETAEVVTVGSDALETQEFEFTLHVPVRTGVVTCTSVARGAGAGGASRCCGGEYAIPNSRRAARRS